MKTPIVERFLTAYVSLMKNNLLYHIKRKNLKFYKIKDDYVLELGEDFVFNRDPLRDKPVNKYLEKNLQELADISGLTLITEFKLFFPKKTLNFHYFNTNHLEEELNDLLKKKIKKSRNMKSSKIKDLEFELNERKTTRSLFRELSKKKEWGEKELKNHFSDYSNEKFGFYLNKLLSLGLIEEQKDVYFLKQRAYLLSEMDI